MKKKWTGSKELETLCYMVKRGKPAGTVAFPERFLEEARGIAIREGMAWCADNYYEGWYCFTVYLKPHMEYVITKAPVFEDPVVEAWYWGKVFGYSEDAIASYTDELSVVALRTGGERVGGVVERDQLATPQTLVSPLAGLLSGGRHLLRLLSRVFLTIIARHPDKNGRPS